MSTSYKQLKEENPDLLFLVECWTRDGYTKSDISKCLGISNVTFSTWLSKHKELAEAVRKGQEPVDYLVENALLKRALGYDYTECRVVYGEPDENGNRKKEVTEFHKHVPPETNACLLWLNNRRPDKWRRNNDAFILTEQIEALGGNITINVVKNDSDSYNKGKGKPKKKKVAVEDEN